MAWRDGGLGDEADHQRGDRDPELGAGEVEGQAPQRGRGGAGAAAARLRVELDPIAVDGDERELDRDEEPGGEDEQEYGDEADRGVDGGIDSRAVRVGGSRAPSNLRATGRVPGHGPRTRRAPRGAPHRGRAARVRQPRQHRAPADRRPRRGRRPPLRARAPGGHGRRHGRRLRPGHRPAGVPQPPHLGRARQRHRQPHQRPRQPHAAGGDRRPAGLPPHRHRPAAVRPARGAGRRHGEVGPRGAHAPASSAPCCGGRSTTPPTRRRARCSCRCRWTSSTRRPGRRPPPSTLRVDSVAGGLEELADLLTGPAVGRVAIVVGDAVAAAGAVPSAVALAEALGAPVLRRAAPRPRRVPARPTRCGRACSRPRPPPWRRSSAPTSGCC